MPDTLDGYKLKKITYHADCNIIFIHKFTIKNTPEKNEYTIM